MSNPSQRPPAGLVPQVQWLVAWVTVLMRRMSALSGGGGGGSITLNENEIAFGSASNEVTSSTDFIYNPSGTRFKATIAGIPSGLFFRDTISAMGDIDGYGNSTSVQVTDDTKTISYYTNGGVDAINLDLSGLSGTWTRTEPNKDGEYTVGLFSGISGPLDTNGEVTVTVAECTTNSVVVITPIATGAAVLTMFTVTRSNGSFLIKDIGGNINMGMTFSYLLINP